MLSVYVPNFVNNKVNIIFCSHTHLKRSNGGGLLYHRVYEDEFVDNIFSLYSEADKYLEKRQIYVNNDYTYNNKINYEPIVHYVRFVGYPTNALLTTEQLVEFLNGQLESFGLNIKFEILLASSPSISNPFIVQHQRANDNNFTDGRKINLSSAMIRDGVVTIFVHEIIRSLHFEHGHTHYQNVSRNRENQNLQLMPGVASGAYLDLESLLKISGENLETLDQNLDLDSHILEKLFVPFGEYIKNPPIYSDTFKANSVSLERALDPNLYTADVFDRIFSTNPSVIRNLLGILKPSELHKRSNDVLKSDTGNINIKGLKARVDLEKRLIKKHLGTKVDENENWTKKLEHYFIERRKKNARFYLEQLKIMFPKGF